MRSRMVTMDEYARIRLAHRDGMSIRAIARTFHHSRHKVRQILDNAEPRPYTRSQVAAAPVLGPFHGIIDEILKTDEEAPPKQRHTAMQLYRRLCAEHAYGGGYDQVRRPLPGPQAAASARDGYPPVPRRWHHDPRRLVPLRAVREVPAPTMPQPPVAACRQH